ncbi:methylamine dehydrogenase heavy chain [Sphingobium sp. JAI105]|uniref:amine dehydrogenase large subunit n=1 Tax=Sphingobium sp. JAI105 TaxID=2787715 RepID=UPI0018CB418A|nr:amine dehydrogenase large subunit [Sphingobium sp. JAI105]MBG6120445.1 methylamine dehydrogenase heavy chain [Sphingobium sp. JAI105]
MFKLQCLSTAILALCCFTAPAHAQLEPEELTKVELAEVMKPHWVWVNDIAFTHMVDGRAYLIDADTGQFLGMVSGGYSHGSVQLSPDGRTFAVPGTFYSRGTRGERTDVVTFYDMKDLAPGEEVVIPPKRFEGIAFLSAMPLTDDGRFSLIYNFTPEQSVTVVDLETRKLVGEFATAGCGLIYPTGDRSFFMQCGDGSLRNGVLDAGGKITLGEPSKPLFDVKDPATEKPVRIGKQQWLFFTYNSQVVIIDGAGTLPKAVGRWSLLGPQDAGWRIGGLQPAAMHRSSGRLFVLMHKGGVNTHKDPGTELWVFDVASHKRVARWTLGTPATTLGISQDDKPLLYTAMFGSSDLAVLDAETGRVLRTVSGLGESMTTIQPAPPARER